MIRTIRLKLNFSDGGVQSILDTMDAYAIAFNVATTWGFENKSSNKVNCHMATYHQVRKMVPHLQSSLVQCARDNACECLKQCKLKSLPTRRNHSAMRYNQRVLSINLLHGIATISTVHGRTKGTFVVPDYFQRYIGWNIKSSTISYSRKNKSCFLSMSMEGKDIPPTDEVNVLGIDRGIVNVAVCSDNSFFNARHIRAVRGRYQHARAELQSKGTRSAKRKLRKLSGRERRFMTDTNHCISKNIVNPPYTVFALEDLSSIRVQKRRGKEFNRKLNNWSFYQLEQFLRYKAEGIGKRVVLIDSRYTSQKCSRCGHIYKGNRKGSWFKCISCGFQLHADLNASRNIAQAGISGLGRVSVNHPNVSVVSQFETSRCKPPSFRRW